MGTPVSFAHLNELFQPAEGGPAQYEGTSGNMQTLSLKMTPATAQNEPGKKMWTEYMKEAENYDNRDAEAWKGDSDGILVFVRPTLPVPLFITMTTWKTGLFSATVGAFIIEFYKKLSPDSGNQTVDLLCQMSQQLPNFTTGTCTPPQAGQSFSPGAAIIWVNCMWMMSLILSLTSALFATLVQQWARRYVQMPQIPSDPNHRARVRSFLFFGTRRYKMRIAIETAPTLLHFSVFLFFAGLVILFYSINKAVAIVISVSVGIFVAAYFVLTILPYIEHSCPYRTPMSNIWWYISHPSLFSGAFCFRSLFTKLHSWFVPYNLGEVRRRRQHILVPLLKFFEDAVKKHKTRLKDGFRETIVRGALDTSDNVDVKALTWWLQLPALAEESKAQDILECIPKETIVQLMAGPIESGKLVFREHLLSLLRSCGPGSLAGKLDEKERKARLLVCLHAIHRISHASVDQKFDVDVVDFVRSNFANMSLMRAMWADSDVGIRTTSRSICALLARCLLSRLQLEGPELGWLQDVTGEPSNTIFNSDGTARDRMNLKAFVYGLLLGQEGDLPTEHATSFTETLAILMEAGSQSPFDRTKFQDQLSALIGRIERDTTEGSGEIVDKLRRMFANFLLAPAPAPAPTPTRMSTPAPSPSLSPSPTSTRAPTPTPGP